MLLWGLERTLSAVTSYVRHAFQPEKYFDLIFNFKILNNKVFCVTKYYSIIPFPFHVPHMWYLQTLQSATAFVVG